MVESDRSATSGAGENGADRLDSWKEIAAHLRRDVTTAQRWERREGMPVHRHVHDRLGSVYAFKSELDAWMRGRAATPPDSSGAGDAASAESEEPSRASAELPGNGESPASANEQASAAALRKNSRSRPLAWAIALGSLVAVVGIALLASRCARPAQATTAAAIAATREPPSTSLARAPSLAVLPFESASAAAESQQLAAGVTEELLSRLAGVRGLRIARASLRDANRPREPRAELARALRVDHLLEGSAEFRGERVRIRARLIDARSHELWSQTFERGPGEVADDVEEEIARAVASALGAPLLAGDEARIRHRATNDPEANRLYWIAYAHLNGQLPAADYELGKRLLERAIERDPDFAAAHAGIARFYFHIAWPLSASGDPEESMRLGELAAERAAALDPDSSEAVMAQAGFAYLRHRFRGDYGAFIEAELAMQRAIALDPANASAFYDACRALTWIDPERALTLCERTLELDPIKVGPHNMLPSLLAIRGQPGAARARCTESAEQLRKLSCRGPPSASLDTYYGDFQAALEANASGFDLPARIQRWSLYMALGDEGAGESARNFGDGALDRVLSEAARHAMDGRHDLAFASLERERARFPVTRLLDAPAAKFALLAGKPEQARLILTQRIPDVANAIEPITGRNLLPALDLATAYTLTGAGDEARALLARITAYLAETPLRLPMISFQQARAHALAGERDAALDALARARQEGFRTTWAVDLRPQPHLYLDPIAADPAFRELKDEPRFVAWLEGLNAENARTREKALAARGGNVLELR